MSFPDDFVWGAATAAYQVEGSPLADGASTSVWHTFAHTPGRIANGETGDVACDHYNRYREDVALMKELGLRAYRFSVSWPRILPERRGKPNPKGIDFYRRLVDELLRANIAPWLTLFHWDHPQWLEDLGGWPNRDSAKHFADYAAVLYEALGDVVRRWITLNEPWCAAIRGYHWGELAPGHTSLKKGLAAAHHLLLGHGLAVRAFRQSGKEGEIGTALNYLPKRPATDRPEDAAATDRDDAMVNRLFLDPLFKKSYPEILRREVPDDCPDVRGDDLEIAAEPMDFLGGNYYRWEYVEDAPDARFPRARRFVPPGAEANPIGQPVVPEGLRHHTNRIHREYTKLPQYITENGRLMVDESEHGEDLLEDDVRIDFVRRHLEQCRLAIRDGVPLRGYFHWSWMDNLEWQLGYRPRHGLIRVDFDTQRRLLKKSARFYARVIAENGL